MEFMNPDEIRSMGVLPLCEKLGMIKQVRGKGTEECPDLITLWETNHLAPMQIMYCRPKAGPRPFDRRIETTDADGHVLVSSRWTRPPVGQKRQRNRSRNRVARAARKRNRR
jgi:hypothetical protein